jgi:hypothetical protein
MTIRVFASGQSNMMGRATDASNWNGVSASVRVWNNVNPLGAVGTAWTTPVGARQSGTFQYLDRNNLAVWFCDKLARTLFEPVDLTLVARGGSTISIWSPAEQAYPMLTHCANVWAATGQAPAHVFLWHQGESDVPAPQGYADAFAALRANLTDAGVIDASTLVIVGGLAENSAERVAFNRDVLRKLPASAYARSYGLPVYDGNHFTSHALTRLGAARYASAYRFARSRHAP